MVAAADNNNHDNSDNGDDDYNDDDYNHDGDGESGDTFLYNFSWAQCWNEWF